MRPCLQLKTKFLQFWNGTVAELYIHSLLINVSITILLYSCLNCSWVVSSGPKMAAVARPGLL